MPTHAEKHQGGAQTETPSALAPENVRKLEQTISDEWHVEDDHRLERRFTFDDFAGALAFTNKVGAVAEQEGHHPDVLLTYGRVDLTLCTHSVDGLTEKDFALAKKVDGIAG